MNQNSDIQNLTEFVQKATKLGKYNANTGTGILNAIRTAEKGLSSEEPKDVDYLLDHLEELFFRQKDLGLSPQSQGVYFARIKRAVEDFKKFGTDARSIYSWSPKMRVKKANNKRTISEKNEDETENAEMQPKSTGRSDEVIKEINGVKLNVVTWRLRPGVLIKIELPEDLTQQDVDKIKKLLDLEIE